MEERKGGHSFFTLTPETLQQLKEEVKLKGRKAFPEIASNTFVVYSEKYLPLVINDNLLSIKGQFAIENRE